MDNIQQLLLDYLKHISSIAFVVIVLFELIARSVMSPRPRSWIARLMSYLGNFELDAKKKSGI